MTHVCKVLRGGQVLYEDVIVDIHQQALPGGNVSLTGEFTLNNPSPSPNGGRYELEREDGQRCEIVTQDMDSTMDGAVTVTFHANSPFRTTAP